MDTIRMIIIGIVILAALAIAYVFIIYSGIPIPSWFSAIVGIVVLTLLAIYAIKFLARNV